MTRPVTVAELQRRFGLPTRRRAIALLKRLRHVRAGREWFTTEEWLAEWVAAEAVPAMDWPRPEQSVDPLEECVIGRVIQLVGELAARGAVRVQAQ